MKSVLISIQPYYVFLIIANTMGWNFDYEKRVEVRKSFPKDVDWDEKAIIYCSKNKQSFNRIPKKYQPLMERFLGKVIGEFTCDKIYKVKNLDTRFLIDNDKMLTDKIAFASCLDFGEMQEYLGSKDGYAWLISNLVIYDKPKELGEFKRAGFMTEQQWLYNLYPNTHCHYEAWAKRFDIKSPPQSWCYVTEVR